MCGIIGYKGNKTIEEVLLNGLKKLEYRGYDSAGVAIRNDKKIRITKSIGKIKELEEKLKKEKTEKGLFGIGHTRWATHGKVTELNSHPHQVGKITIVHNGIIENYKELEKELSKKGYKFKTDTDTERLAALIDSFYKKNNYIQAIEKAMEQVKGSFAILIMFEDDDKHIYGVKKDAPLILGIGKNENFLASDISAIIPYTKKYVILEDKEIIKLDSNQVEIYYSGVIIEKPIETATWSIEDSEKQGYDHFMLKEINEQSEISKKLFSKYIPNNKFSKEIIDITKYKKIEIVACGSAYHAGLIGKHFIDKYLINKNLYCEVEVASEYRYKEHNYDVNTLVILISQSGETADTLACLRLANENKIDTLAIVNVNSSTIAREAKYVLPMLAGPEICVATTKGYFSQVYLLILLILKAMTKIKRINKEQKEIIIEDIKNIHKDIINVIKDNDYKKIAQNIYKEENMYFIGRSIDSLICEEASLKLKEISYIHSECFKAGELKHGPIALISKDTPVIAILTEKSISEKMVSNIIEASSRGAKIVLITSLDIDTTAYRHIIKIPQKISLIEPLPTIIACQILAYEIAKLRKCEIDKPRNLAKSVTVE